MATIKTKGLTLIELIVCTVIIGILSSAAPPISRNFIRYEKEEALKTNLRDLREAIDRYRDKIRQQSPEKPEEECYPVTLQDLVEQRILRKIPRDPMTLSPDWRTRSTSDPLNSSFSDGKNVFDVFSCATGTAHDGTLYSSW